MRRIPYFTRPTLLGAYRELAAMNIADQHDHPRIETLPKNEKFYVVFAHPWHSQGIVRCLVVWERRGIGWWMDVPMQRWSRLPRELVDHPWRLRV